jgi:hypothetical protein
MKKQTKIKYDIPYKHGYRDGYSQALKDVEKKIDEWYLKNRKKGISVGFYWEELKQSLKELGDK